MINEESLTDNEYDIYQFLQSTDTSNMTAQEIADRFYVARSMVYRVVKKMGYKTFSAYKYGHNRSKADLDRSFAINVEHLYTDVSLAELAPIVETMQHAVHLYIYASEATTIASQYLCRQLVNLGYLSFWISDGEEFTERRRRFTTGDVLLVISNSGENLAINPTLGDLQLPLIALTRGQSSLQRMATYAITYDFEDYRYENSFDRENLFPLFVILQRLLISLKDSQQKLANK